MSSENKKIAIINKDKCKPDKCSFECGLLCPVNKQKKECVTLVDIENIGNNIKIIDGVKKKKIARISEITCIGCGQCVKKNSGSGCPFNAIMLVQIPIEVKSNLVYTYGENSFRLYKMPIITQSKILGLIGQNGIGKTTIITILAGRIKPNFDIKDKILNDEEIITKFRGNEMQSYMEKLYKNELSVVIKPQNVDTLIKMLKSKNLDYTVEEYIMLKNNYDVSSEWYQEVINTLELNTIMNYKVCTLSGGELQKIICARVFLTKANVYIFDEPTNYLDVIQRLNVAKLVRKLNNSDNYIIVIEHDLAILDYMTDNICISYGVPSAYGIVSRPITSAKAINIYFDGYIPDENMRFRQHSFNNINLSIVEETFKFSDVKITYDAHKISYDKFKLNIMNGQFPIEGSITVILGKNGTGKTTFINYIADIMKSTVSYKPQYLSISQFLKTDGTYPTVLEYLFNNIGKQYHDPMFISDVVKPLNIRDIEDRYLDELSGGELQRFWIVLCLGKEANIYLFDEASACLDIEQRMNVTKIIKRFVLHNKKVAFVVEHDMMMAVSLGKVYNSQAILAEEVESTELGVRSSVISEPMSFDTGINKFLKSLNITFHTHVDSGNCRPRINKLDSVKDREQKLAGIYYE